MTHEKDLKPANPYVMLFVFFLLFLGSIAAFAVLENAWFLAGVLTSLFILPGFILVNPNGSRVILLFGDYKGTVKKNGLFWVNLFTPRRKFPFVPGNLTANALR